MKKWVALIALGIMVFLLTACASFTCEICREEKSGKKYTNKITSVLLDDENPICEDCYKEIVNALGN